MKPYPSHVLIIVIAVFLTASFANAQTISYMLPDIGAPGMNVHVEFVAPHDAIGNFGSDGVYLNRPGDDVRLECADGADTGAVTIGPLVVSWDGRLISTQIFVHPHLDPPSSDWNVVGPDFEIPLRFVRGGGASNAESFYIVRPQPAIVDGGTGGELGSGGRWGVRSRRGAMILDSLDLRGDTYTISIADVDIAAPGNQGFLPAVVLSRGPVRFGANTRMHVDAEGKIAGPGGGGGGGNFCDFTGDGTNGGDGFTGGGPGGRNRSGNPFGSDEYRNPGTGSGAMIGMTGGSLNGVPGGNSPAYEASGGGTGHPFGTSGEGCDSGSRCNPPGGHGGGSGQQQTLPGGGGGYATAGGSSNNGNGGRTHGNEFIVPLAGGSGGASGNPQQGFSCSGDGGGGAGALRLSATAIEGYLFTADGAGGGNGTSGDGGSGSGGAVELQAKLASGVWKITALGGTGAGTPGGAGRIRMDGPIGWFSSGIPAEESVAQGPSTDTTMFVRRTFELTGTGNGEDVHLYLKSRSEPWTLIELISGYGSDWRTDITLPENGDSLFFLAVLQQLPNASSERYTARPSHVFSQAAANILVLQTIPELVADDMLSFPEMRCEDIAVDTVIIRNEGDGLLFIEDAFFLRGNQGFALLQPTAFPLPVAPGAAVEFVIRSSRIPGVTGRKADTLVLEHNARGRNPFHITVEQEVQEASLTASSQSLTLPELLLCNGTSTDTVLILRNNGTVPLRIVQPQFSNPAFSIVQPAPPAFPLVIETDSSLQLQLRVTHGGAGTQTGTLLMQADSSGCFVEQLITLSARAWEPELNVSALDPFPTLLCDGEFADDTLLLRNNGEDAVEITSIMVTDAAFAVLSPAVPRLLPPDAELPVVIRFAPIAAGNYSASVIVEAEPCALRFERELEGTRESVRLAVDPLDFGLIRAENLPVTATTMIRNTGTTDITVSSSVDVPPYRVIGGLPVTISPGGSAPLNLQFDDPGSDGDYSTQIALLHDPVCEPLFVRVSGRRATARIVLIADTLSAGPSEEVDVVLYLRNAENLRLFGATGITVNLRYEKSLLVPLFDPPGSIVGDERIIPLDLPLTTEANDVAMRLRFMVTLGTALQTPLELTDVEAVGGDLTVEVVDGQFTLLDVCREGAPRLFDGSASIALEANRPNPFNPVTTIRFSVIEEGRSQLYVLDVLGRRVATLVDGMLPAGEHSAVFDGSGLPSGVYFSVLQTPTVVKMRRMLLAK